MKTVKQTAPSAPRSTPPSGLGRMVFLSLAAHLAVVLSFTVGLIPLRQTPPREVYHVDLVNLPVKDPQAGRPDVRPMESKKPEPPQPAPPPAQPKPVPPAPKVEAKPAPKPTPKPAPKLAVPVKPKAKPAEQKAVAPAAQSDPLKAIEEMRRRQEMEELKQKLARLSQSDTRSPATSQAPVGMPTGKGTEAGVSYDAWIHDYLKAAWSLSKYQVGRLDLEARVRLQFDARGNLRNYEFTKESGDSRFDDSVRRAILQLKELPNEPGRPLDLNVTFNLKDLLE